MNFVAQDATKLIALMIAGGGFALAGLWLMFRPKPEGGAAKLELFGMKFEASSAGLLVFLIGAGFLAIPLFVPERSNQANRASDLEGDLSDQDMVSTVGKSAETQSLEKVNAEAPAALAGRNAIAITIEAKEIEENNTIASANQAKLGTVVSGTVTKGDTDYYSVEIPENITGEIVANVMAEGGDWTLTLFDDAGAALTSGGQFNTSVSRDIVRPRYYVLVANKGHKAIDYRLSIAARQN